MAVATEGQRHLKGWADVVDCLHIVATTQLHVAHMCHGLTSKWMYLSVIIFIISAWLGSVMIYYSCNQTEPHKMNRDGGPLPAVYNPLILHPRRPY